MYGFKPQSITSIHMQAIQLYTAVHGLRLPNHGAICIPILALEYMKRGAKGSDGQACVLFGATAMASCL